MKQAKQQKQKQKQVKHRDMAAAALASGAFKRAIHKDGKKEASRDACRKWRE